MNSSFNVLDKKIKDKKLFLLIIASLVAAIGIFLFVVSLITNIDKGYTVLFAIIAVCDSLFAFITLKSNFRFKYTKISFIIHTVIVCLLDVLLIYKGKNTATRLSTVIYVIFQLLYIVAYALCMKRQNEKTSGIKFLAFAFTIIFCVASFFYLGLVAKQGYFGQGGLTYRSLIYNYDNENGGYAVVGISKGSGKNVIIPEKFNGKKITSLNTSIFADANLEKVFLNCDADVTLSYFETIYDNPSAKIFVAKDKVRDFGTNVENMVKIFRDNFSIALFNNIVPADLDSDETYVSFRYNKQTAQQAGYDLIKPWIDKKGSVFHLSLHESAISYCQNYDVTNESFLYDNYTSSGNIVLINDGNGTIENKEINNKTEVNVSFSKVYRISIADTNDTVYNANNAVAEASFKSFNGTGYRYVLSDTNILNEKPQRVGFSLKWKYTSTQSPSKTTVYNLANILPNANLTLYPEWVMDKPNFSLKTTKTGSTSALTAFTYGDSVSFSNQENKGNTGFTYEYEWTLPGGSTKNTSDFTISKILISDKGTYSVTVNCSSSTSSLTSTDTKTITISVAKKELQFVWKIDGNESFDNLVYNGNQRTITAEVVDSTKISGDVIDYSISLDGALNADNYTSTITLNGTTFDNYSVVTNQKTKVFVIAKKSISNASVEVDNVAYNGTTPISTLVYNGATQSMNVTSVSVDGLTPTYDVSGNEQASAGTYELTITGNGNFTGSKKVRYTIGKKDATITWGETSFVYNGNKQYPRVTAVDGTIASDNFIDSITYKDSTKKIDVGSNYLCEIDGYDKNYNIVANTTCTYSITPKPIDSATVALGSSLTYNGQTQTQSISFVKVEGLTVSTYQVSNNTGINVGNYQLTIVGTGNFSGSVNKAFTISQLNISSATVTLGTSLTYNGESQEQSVSSVKVGTVTVDTYKVSNNTATNAGSYQLTVTGEGNFTGSVQKSFSINKKSITSATIVLTATSFEYNGTVQTQTLDSITVDGLTPTYSLSNNSGVNAGTYYFNVNGTGNFTGSVQKSFTIAKKQVSVAWGNGSFLFDGSAKEYKPTITGLINQNDVTISYYNGNVKLNSAPTNVGTYKAVVEINLSNYNVSGNSEMTFTIVEETV